MRGLIALLVILAPIAAAQATEDDQRTVAAMAGKARVLIAFAPTLADARMNQQRTEMARFAIGAAQRDLVFVQVDQTHVIGAKDLAADLRAHFQVPPSAYRTLLIGKEGGIDLTANGPIPADRLAQVIDATPSRQEEVRRAHAGRPVESHY